MFRPDRTVVGLLIVGLWGLSACAADSPRPVARGPEFHRAWESRVSASLDSTPLRRALDQFCSPHKIAYVIDRRLDPEGSVTSRSNDSPLSEFLSHLLESINADVTIVGNSVIVGPQESVQWLRTLTVGQRTEFLALPGAAPAAAAMARTVDVRWDDLTEPRGLVTDLAKRAKVSLEGVEQIPYDQWGAGDLIGVTAGEGLSVIAWQYGLRLQWVSVSSAKLVPFEGPVATSKVVTVPPTKREAAQAEFPSLTWEMTGNSHRVIGRIEEIEALERWLKGTSPRKPRKLAPSPWRTKRYTFKVVDTPVLSILKRLQEQGFPVIYDEAELTRAGIKATSKLDLDVQTVTADELMLKICRPFGLEYDLTETDVTVRAAKP